MKNKVKDYFKKKKVQIMVLMIVGNMLFVLFPKAVLAAVESNDSPIAQEEEVALVETWMPDPLLRKAVAKSLSTRYDTVLPEELTKEMVAELKSLNFSQYELAIPLNTVVDLTGLEYAKNQLISLDTTQIIAKNIPAITLQQSENGGAFLQTRPNVLPHVTANGSIRQLTLGRSDISFAANELEGLGQYINVLNPTEWLRVYSIDMTDFSLMGLSPSLNARGLFYSTGFTRETPVRLSPLIIENNESLLVQYEDAVMKKIDGDRLISSRSQLRGSTFYRDSENNKLSNYVNCDYTEEGLIFHHIPDEAVEIIFDFDIYHRMFSTYAFVASIPIVRATQGADVTIQYVDQQGIKINDSKKISGTLNAPYDVTSADYKLAIDGYMLDEEKLPENAIGIFTEQEQVVTYSYKQLAAPVIVNYQTESGDPLVEAITLNGFVGESYTTEEKIIKGYQFKEIQGNKDGVFSLDSQAVTYIYEKQKHEIVAPVIVKHQDEWGEKIAEEVQLTGNIGAAYETKEEKIAGYHLKEIKGESKGVFSTTPKTVIYVYQKQKEKITEEVQTDTSMPTENFDSSKKQLPKTGENSQFSGFLNGLGILTVLFILFCLVKARKI